MQELGDNEFDCLFIRAEDNRLMKLCPQHGKKTFAPMTLRARDSDVIVMLHPPLRVSHGELSVAVAPRCTTCDPVEDSSKVALSRKSKCCTNFSQAGSLIPEVLLCPIDAL